MTLTFRIPLDLYEALRKQAKANERNVSEEIRYILKTVLKTGENND
jgi:hypothetical protein